ncbi:copper resistance protein CopC [uncultured Microbacterium sp.]|uniref:copper resistance CopC family protein n=1 Tax=uncultured Microbacterium sp. TaxID=191216 RepID=UPI0035CA2688
MKSASRRVPRTSALVAALAIAAAALLAFASPAAAHDELVSSDPAADATLAALPAALTLTFSADLLGDAGATEVQVTDASGASIADGAPVVQANVVTQALTAGATGSITVLWRVVSSDGHPIADQYAFTVTAGPTPTPAPTPTPTASTTPTASPSPLVAPPVATPSADPVPSDAGSSALPWAVLGVVAAAVLGGVVYLLVSRARRVAELEKARMSGLPASPESTPPGPSEPGSDTPADR